MKLAPMLIVALLAGVTVTTVLAEAPWALKNSAGASSNDGGWIRTYSVLSSTNPNVSIGTQAWRVVNNTGNANENHISVGPTGRIIDIGGTVPVFSDDEGATWKVLLATGILRPIVLGAEGSGSFAPNGDWVGMTWDPQYADRVIAYKWVAAENQWYTSHVALHGPFYDRPWIGVIAGPITVGGQTFPYATVLRGGAVTTTSYVSFDGLTYLAPSPADASPVNRLIGYLDFTSLPAPWLDWTHPTAHSAVIPLPDGGAMMKPDHVCSWALIRPDMTHHCFSFQGAVGSGFPANPAARVDSQGRIHLFEQSNGHVKHRMSGDGGRTWKVTNLPLPAGATYQGNMVDSAANGSLDMIALSIRADVSTPTGPTTKILVYKLTNLSAATPTIKIYQVGNGDFRFSQGVLAGARFDFQTIGLLPDGRVVTSFGDAQHLSPRIAIEQP